MIEDEKTGLMRARQLNQRWPRLDLRFLSVKSTEVFLVIHLLWDHNRFVFGPKQLNLFHALTLTLRSFHMALLVTGVILWSLVHFLPAGARGRREKMVGSLGEGPYKGLFSLLSVAAIVLIVLGWRSTTPAPVYAPMASASHITLLLMVVVFYLLGSANAPSNIKRFIRHPMLIGVALWGVAHLLANGDNRSIVLFGGIGLWAIIMIPFINKRDGARQKPDPVSLVADLRLLVIAAVLYVVFIFLHPYFAGVSPLGS
jgi:uncharacterized membrane protein